MVMVVVKGESGREDVSKHLFSLYLDEWERMGVICVCVNQGLPSKRGGGQATRVLSGEGWLEED